MKHNLSEFIPTPKSIPLESAEGLYIKSSVSLKVLSDYSELTQAVSTERKREFADFEKAVTDLGVLVFGEMLVDSEGDMIGGVDEESIRELPADFLQAVLSEVADSILSLSGGDSKKKMED